VSKAPVIDADFAVDFRLVHVLDDGTKVEIRPIRASDAALLQRGFEELSPESRYRRFFGTVSRLSDATLRYLTDVDGEDHVAIVATCDSPDLKTERGLGIARFVRVAEADGTRGEVAEAAVTVVDDMQRHGLGRELLTVLAATARARGIKRFRADILASNEPMRRLLDEVKPVIVSEADGVLTVDVPLEDRAASLEREWTLGRLFRAAASQVAVLVRQWMPPDV
jgi:GNAT superfamily N-acetyltransferase